MVKWEDRNILYVGKFQARDIRNLYAFVDSAHGKVACETSYSLNELAAYIRGATQFNKENVIIQNGIPKDINEHLSLSRRNHGYPLKKLSKNNLQELLNCAGLVDHERKMEIRR